MARSVDLNRPTCPHLSLFDFGRPSKSREGCIGVPTVSPVGPDRFAVAPDVETFINRLRERRSLLVDFPFRETGLTAYGEYIGMAVMLLQ